MVAFAKETVDNGDGYAKTTGGSQAVQDVEWDQAREQANGARRTWHVGAASIGESLAAVFARIRQTFKKAHKSSSLPPTDKSFASTSNFHFSTVSSTTPVPSTFDKLFPPRKQYLGRFNRKTFLILLAIMLFSALAMTVGLAAGLTIPSQKFANSTHIAAAQDGQYSGQMTYFTDGLGACGVTSGPNDYIVALSEALFDPQTPNGNPNNNPLCGQKLTAYLGGNSIELTVVDRCTGCAEYDIDTTETAFSQLADPSAGRVDVTWSWTN